MTDRMSNDVELEMNYKHHKVVVNTRIVAERKMKWCGLAARWYGGRMNISDSMHGHMCKAQGDDPEAHHQLVHSQVQDKQQLLPEDLPERFYATCLGEEKEFSNRNGLYSAVCHMANQYII